MTEIDGVAAPLETTGNPWDRPRPAWEAGRAGWCGRTSKRSWRLVGVHQGSSWRTGSPSQPRHVSFRRLRTLVRASIRWSSRPTLLSNFLVAGAAFRYLVSLWPNAQIDLWQGPRGDHSSKQV